MSVISLSSKWEEWLINDGENIYNRIQDEWYIFEQGKDLIVDNYLKVISKSELKDKIRSNEYWLKFTRLFLDYIEQTLKFSSPSYIIIISDKDGYCIDLRCNDETKNFKIENNISLGACYSENIFRKNGIGTAILMKRPVLVTGSENQRTLLRKWTCVSVPIIGNKKELYGVFSILVPNNSLKLFYLSLASSVVRNIETELCSSLEIQETQEYNPYDPIQRHDDVDLVQVFDRQFSFLWRNMTQGIIVMNHDYKVKFINPAARRLLHAARDCVDRSIYEISNYVLGEDLKLVKTLDELQRFTDEITVNINGEEMYLLVDTDVLYDNQGNIFGASAILTDLTDMRKAKKNESQTKQMESELFEGILNNLPVGVIAYNNRKIITFVNKTFELLTGFARKELINLTISKVSNLLQLLNSNDNMIISDSVLETKRPEKAFRASICQKGGKEIEVLFSSFPVQENSQGFVALTIVIDKSMENSFEHFRGYAKATLQCMQSGVIAFDCKNFKINMLNPEAESILGVTSGEVLGMPLYKAFPGMSSELTQISDELGNNKKQVRSKIINVSTENGLKKLMLNAELVLCIRGNQLGVVVVFNDISEK